MSDSDSPNSTLTVLSQYLNKIIDGVVESFNVSAMFSQSPEELFPETIFPNNSKWKDKATLSQTVNEHARVSGFVTTKTKQYVSCNRYGNYSNSWTLNECL